MTWIKIFVQISCWIFYVLIWLTSNFDSMRLTIRVLIQINFRFAVNKIQFWKCIFNIIFTILSLSVIPFEEFNLRAGKSLSKIFFILVIGVHHNIVHFLNLFILVLHYLWQLFWCKRFNFNKSITSNHLNSLIGPLPLVKCKSLTIRLNWAIIRFVLPWMHRFKRYFFISICCIVFLFSKLGFGRSFAVVASIFFSDVGEWCRSISAEGEWTFRIRAFTILHEIVKVTANWFRINQLTVAFLS